jgi:outer membrane protein
MRTMVTASVTALFMLLSLSASSQSQLKIGHVNFDEVMLAMPERDSAQAIITKESKELSAAYDELSVQYNKLYGEYQKGLSSFSDITKKMKEDELLDKQKRLSEFEQNASATLQKRNNELFQPIIAKINKAIEKVASEYAFTYILDISKGSVAYVSKESQNITAQVLKIVRP